MLVILWDIDSLGSGTWSPLGHAEDDVLEADDTGGRGGGDGVSTNDICEDNESERDERDGGLVVVIVVYGGICS